MFLRFFPENSCTCQIDIVLLRRVFKNNVLLPVDNGFLPETLCSRFVNTYLTKNQVVKKWAVILLIRD